MKEATGELNMTVITVVALAAVGALFYTFVWPMIKHRIINTTCETMGANYEAQKSTDECADNCFPATEDDAEKNGTIWCCCDSTKTSNSTSNE